MATIPKRIRNEVQCPNCDKSMLSAHLARHKKKCQRQDDCCYDCPFCSFMGCRTLDYMKTHCGRKHGDCGWKCKKCGWEFTAEGFFEKDHVDTCLKVTRDQIKAAPVLQAIRDAEVPDYEEDPLYPPEDDNDPMWQEYNDKANDQIRSMWFQIRQHFETSNPSIHKYVFRVVGSDITKFSFEDALRFIYAREDRAFAFNINMNYLLCKDVDDEDESVPDKDQEGRIWIPTNGQNTAFEKNLVVHDLATLKLALEKMPSAGGRLEDEIERGDTKWVYAGPLSYVFWVYVRPSFMLGGHGPGKDLPTKFTKSKCIRPMLRDKHDNAYTDKLCFFRSLTSFLGRDYDDLEEVWTVYEKYRRHVNGPFWWDFDGLQLELVPIVEDIWDINVRVLKMESDGSLELMRKPLNVNRRTFSYIFCAVPKKKE